ncbi:MAG: 8-oxoguanine DNA glycosylase [Methanoregulaceae archaeon]|jgi:N-glycosylase/DNA lyase|nr:8-oxoguanine DNA glycosylase [Methanoregulaceae archaeon]
MLSLTLSADQPFNLDKTLSCGQVFRWVEAGGWWTGIVGDKVIRIRQDGDHLTWDGTDEPFIRHYFSLDLDLPAILSGIDRDPIIHQAIEECRGLRIIRQPPWECLVSYIIATFTNIPSIKRRITLLCREFGNEISSGGEACFSFPTQEALARAEECQVRACSLGYRAPYLCQVAQQIEANPGWAGTIRKLPYEEARTELMQYRGVGRKVADCVLLFGFGRLEAVPVDVWIERIIRQHYLNSGEKANYEYLRRYAQDYFGPFAGYAQEYLFCMRNDIAKK